MATDRDIKKDKDTAYQEAAAHWGAYLTEAKRDHECYLGKQWDAVDEAYLKGQGREALVFNRARRIVKLLTGYQRKIRLSMRIEPTEGSDEQTASQLSGVCQHGMNYCNGYNIMSEAFEQGALKTGINLVNIYMDRTDDMVDGDIKLKQVPYNRFLMDPNFSDRGLSDCGYILRREYLSPEAVKAILPAARKGQTVDILAKTSAMDNKFTFYQPTNLLDGNFPLIYDEFWCQRYKDVKILINPMNGKRKEFDGTQKQLNDIQRQIVSMGFQPLKVIRGSRRTVELHIFVNDHLMHSGPEPNGLDDYPFVPVIGFFDPEYDKSDYKLQSLVRCIRDPQTEVNKRRSKMLDIIDSQIQSGWIAEEDSVVNKKSLYQAGQGLVVWLKKAMGRSIDERAKKLPSADIPPGLFQLADLMDKDLDAIAGANSELFGMAENEKLEVAALLSKMRQSSGLTVLQDLFDNYRSSKKLLGQKMVKLIQQNYSPQKIMRIINEQPTREFFDQKFGKYDCVPTEGLLTDTQRQMYFAQLIQLKDIGAPIPWTAIVKAAPIEDKDELLKEIQANEQAQSKQQQEMLKLQMIDMMLKQVKTQGEIADTKKDLAQAEENRTQAMLDRVKAVKEMQNMDFDQFMQVANLLKELSEQQQLQHTVH